MIYILKLISEGDFPGSPDIESVIITEADYHALYGRFFMVSREPFEIAEQDKNYRHKIAKAIWGL